MLPIVPHFLHMSDNQNHLKVNDTTYRATETPTPGTCRGCAFPKGFGCALGEWRYAKGVDSGPACRPVQREDKRHIVWVRSGTAAL